MDPPQNLLSNRWHSSMASSSSIIHHSFHISPSPAPRNASTWDSFQGSSHHPIASGISRRISSVTTYSSTLAQENSDAGNIVARKGSAWDATAVMFSGARASASGIARRRASVAHRHQERDGFSGAPPVNEGPSNKMADATATVLHRSFKWDPFAGAPPRNDGSTWSWMSEIVMTSEIHSAPYSSYSVTSAAITQVFYAGNIKYIFETHDGKYLAMADVEAIMHVYGVENTSAQDIVKKVDPKRSGIFNVNSDNKQILLSSTTNFSNEKEPLSVLRHASKCFQDNMLSPLHFAAYIFEVLKDKYFGFEPKFMILGMYGLLGVLEGSTKRLQTTKDVETFTSVWRILNANETKDLITLINNDYRGAINCTDFYFLLYRRNWVGKQLVQKFYNFGEKNPSMLFSLIDKDKDGLLSSDDLRNFAANFGQHPSDKAISELTRQLDMDGDGNINSEDFCLAMVPILDGITWEFWLVAILLTWEF